MFHRISVLLERLSSGKIGQMASSLLQYVGWQCAGGALASLLFWLVHPLLYKKARLETVRPRGL